MHLRFFCNFISLVHLLRPRGSPYSGEHADRLGEQDQTEGRSLSDLPGITALRGDNYFLLIIKNIKRLHRGLFGKEDVSTSAEEKK